MQEVAYYFFASYLSDKADVNSHSTREHPASADRHVKQAAVETQVWSLRKQSAGKNKKCLQQIKWRKADIKDTEEQSLRKAFKP